MIKDTTQHFINARSLWLLLFCPLLIIAACGNGDDGATDDLADSAAVEPTVEVEPTPTSEPTPPPDDDEASSEESVTEPTPTAEPEPVPTEVPDESAEPESEPAPDVDFAPELAGLTDWRNIDPVSLEGLRGEPVILVFWNSI